jgi:hypothetical protein
MQATIPRPANTRHTTAVVRIETLAEGQCADKGKKACKYRLAHQKVTNPPVCYLPCVARNGDSQLLQLDIDPAALQALVAA